MATIEEGYGRKEGYDIIAADKVEGTAVYNMAGDKVGTIKNVMIDKLSGKVVYATMASGGVLGRCESDGGFDELKFGLNVGDAHLGAVGDRIGRLVHAGDAVTVAVDAPAG